MGDLQRLIVAILVIGVVVLATTVCVSVGTRRRMLRSGYMPPAVADRQRAALLDAIKEASTEKGTQVVLSGFWRGQRYQQRRLSAAQKYFVMNPLLQRGIIRPAESTDKLEATVQGLWRNVLNRPVSCVVLNERDWMKMSQGSSGIHIGTMHGGIVQLGDGNTASQSNSADLDAVQRIVEALRRDSDTSAGVEKEELSSIADSLEIDVSRGRWTQVQKTLDTVAGLVASGTKVMAATAEVLGSFD